MMRIALGAQKVADSSVLRRRKARKRLHEERHRERKERVEAKVAELKSKLQIVHPAEGSKS
jgi:hypothetical protein